MHQKGFSPITVLLIVAGILVVGGFWYYEAHLSSPTHSTVGGSSDQSGTAVNSPTGTVSSWPLFAFLSTSTPSTTLNTPIAQPISSSETTMCSAQFDATTSVGTSVIEIKNDSLFIDGVEKISNIPEALGFSASNAGIGFQDPNTSPCPNPSDTVPSSTLVYDQFTNMKASPRGDEVAVIYFRDEYSPDASGFAPTASKMLVFNSDGRLLSETNLQEWNSKSRRYELYWAPDGTMLSFDGFSAVFEKFDDKGSETTEIIRNGMVTDTSN